MPRRKSEEPKQSVSLHIGSSFASAWESVLLPWFKSAALASLESNETVAVVTPFPSGAAFLRAKLLGHEIPLLGVKFITPAHLRELLLAEDASSFPLREHLRLLLATAAESVASRISTDVDPAAVAASAEEALAAIAKSISRSPDNLLRVFDQVGAAGWDFQSIGAPAVREIIQEFQRLVRQCEFKLIHEADRDALSVAKSAPSRFSHLLLIGFTAKHWPLWPLLQAAVSFARRATLVLEYPREQTRAADESWIGTWEQHFDSAAPIADRTERNRPFVHLNQPENIETDSASRGDPQFLVGLNATEQAQAICAIALKFLAEKSCTRLGILFPRAGALARLVSEFLTRAGIPHHDAIGHLTPGEFEEPAWNAWLHLQENHQLEPVLRFLEANPDSMDGTSMQEVRENLRWVYRQILIDDINVLREFCARQTEKEKLVRIAKLLRSIAFLPSKATLAQFLAETKSIFSKLKWDNRWTEIERFAQRWSDASPLEFSRAIYLRWMKEILDSFTIARAPQAGHVYSRVHLLSYGEADGHEWSHLILAGLNQGEWPQSQRESEFLSDQEIVDLNTRASRRGKQGEGHSVLARDKTFLLSAQDERQIALRQFSAALESAEHGLAITASLLQESAPERVSNPSELFSQAYFVARNAPLSQKTMSILREKTFAWLKDQELFESAPATDAGIDQTRIAYEARRKADVPFGEYEFALREPIDREITLRATEWDKVVKTPALIWLKKYLGVENQEPDLNQWNAATGTWVHDWLARIAASEKNTFVDFPTGDEMCERIESAAHRFRKAIVDLCANSGRTVPDWWSSGWSNALALADFLASKLAEVDGSPRMAAEWRLESPQLLSLSDGNKLRVRGRIDLILAQAQPNDSQLTGADVWIVDYKTGNMKPLTPPGKTPEARAANLRKKLVRGDAIQLGLYGLAARELGAAQIHLSILSLRTELDRPQLDMTALAADSDFWTELYRMQETGIFGLRGLIRNEFGFSPDYPLATLPIDKEFLDEKWVLTHPAFADDEDDRS
jgi:PD-(D/E)XK nuclease superfamily